MSEAQRQVAKAATVRLVVLTMIGASVWCERGPKLLLRRRYTRRRACWSLMQLPRWSASSVAILQQLLRKNLGGSRCSLSSVSGGALHTPKT
jgi:hypothetical protein